MFRTKLPHAPGRASENIVVLVTSFGEASPWVSKAVKLWSRLFSTVISNACCFVFVVISKRRQLCILRLLRTQQSNTAMLHALPDEFLPDKFRLPHLCTPYLLAPRPTSHSKVSRTCMHASPSRHNETAAEKPSGVKATMGFETTEVFQPPSISRRFI